MGILQSQYIVIWTNFVLLLKVHNFQQLSHSTSFVQLVKKIQQAHTNMNF